MFWKAIMLIVMGMAARGTEADELYHMSDEFIAEINARATAWQAARNFPKDTDQDFLNSLSCTWINKTVSSPITKPYEAHSEDHLPEQFDARKNWNNCVTLKEIDQQGSCGSCWAVSSASVISDRLCIQKGLEFRASSEDIISCCPHCGSCRGGSPVQAFEYFCEVGVVSGGNGDTGYGCKPYSHEISTGIVPSCVRRCTNPEYRKSYQNDLHQGSKAYTLDEEEAMKHDLFENGPLTVGFAVYQDFYNYHRGVYRHTTGKFTGRNHAVRLIGWGVEDGTPYWLIANSWGASWGDHGTFKFLRGSDHLGIESLTVATVMT